MKICPNCGSSMEDSANFCDRCGTRFPEQTQSYTNYPQQQPQPAAYEANPQPYQPPKKKSGGLWIGLIACIMAVVSIVFFVSQKLGGGGMSYVPSGNYGSVFKTDDRVPYSKGSIENGSYVNKWANMRIDLPEGWEIGSTEEFASYEGASSAECGIVLDDVEMGRQLVVAFGDMDGATVTEDDCLDVLAEGMEEGYAAFGLDVSISSYTDTVIAGKAFRTVQIDFGGVDVVQTIHACRYDGYMIIVLVTSQNELESSIITSFIQTAR